MIFISKIKRLKQCEWKMRTLPQWTRHASKISRITLHMSTFNLGVNCGTTANYKYDFIMFEPDVRFIHILQGGVFFLNLLHPFSGALWPPEVKTEERNSGGYWKPDVTKKKKKNWRFFLTKHNDASLISFKRALYLLLGVAKNFWVK